MGKRLGGDKNEKKKDEVARKERKNDSAARREKRREDGKKIGLQRTKDEV